jgi:DNA-binding GntR family transcriptional regulator
MSKPRERRKQTDVADRIARDIQSGALAPGMWLKQIDLERRYGCTRLEIRRALDRLAQRRLVEHVLNRGYHVFAPDGTEVAEITEIRCILETAAVDSIVANADPTAVNRLDALARRFDELILTGTLLEQYETNLAFHRELLSLCANRELAKLVNELRSRTSSAPAGQWRTRARIEQSAREHHAMVKALAASDALRLREILSLHIRQPGTAAGQGMTDDPVPISLSLEERLESLGTRSRAERMQRPRSRSMSTRSG